MAKIAVFALLEVKKLISREILKFPHYGDFFSSGQLSDVFKNVSTWVAFSEIRLLNLCSQLHLLDNFDVFKIANFSLLDS